MELEHLTPNAALKLASLAVHAEEFFSPNGHEFDKITILSLLADQEIRLILDDKNNAVLLPRRR